MTYHSPQLPGLEDSRAGWGNLCSARDKTPAKSLRPYQSEAIRRVYDAIRAGSNRVCLAAPTAFGKTVTSARIVSDAVGRGRRVAFCVPAIDLVDQTVAAFEAQGIGPIGVIQADHPRALPDAPVQVCSVDTLARRGVPEGYSVVIVDEAHRKSSLVRRWQREQPETVFIGLTATPGRASMREEYQDLIVTATAGDLIEQGYLSKYRVFAPSAPDMSNARTRRGDFVDADARAAMEEPSLTADIVTTWLERGECRPTLLFAVDRAHAANLQAQFQAEGVNCGYQDAHTDSIERKHIAAEFRAGRMPIVANVGTLTTGVDWDVRCIILARPTRSKMLHIQIIGRGLRTAEGKDACLIFDHAGNIARLGFPEDIDWSRFPEKGEDRKTAERKDPMPKTCGKCSFVMAPKTRACPACGFEAPPPSGFIETEDGELVEISRSGEVEPGKSTPKEDKQLWYSQLLWLREEKQRSHGWVAHTYRKKFGVWPRALDDTPLPPSNAVRGYVRSCDIAYAKIQAKEKFS